MAEQLQPLQSHALDTVDLEPGGEADGFMFFDVKSAGMPVAKALLGVMLADLNGARWFQVRLPLSGLVAGQKPEAPQEEAPAE